MKTKTQVLIAVLLLITHVQKGECQKADTTEHPSIEPRRFITIYEEHQGSELEAIWWMYKTKETYEANNFDKVNNTDKKASYTYHPYQKYQVIGEKATIRVGFDHEYLAASYNFSGSLSLEAHSDDEPVEVNPYYTTGQGQSFYGVNSVPTLEMADYIVKLVFDVKQSQGLILRLLEERNEKLGTYKALQSGIAKVKGDVSDGRTPFDLSSQKLKENYATKVVDQISKELIALHEEGAFPTRKIDIAKASPNLLSKIGVLQALVVDDVFDKIFNYQFVDAGLSIDQVLRYLESLKQEITGSEKVLRERPIESFPIIRFNSTTHKTYNELLNTLGRVNLYVNHIASQSNDVQTAFLALLGLNVTEFQEVKKHLNNLYFNLNNTSVDNWSKHYSNSRESSISNHVDVDSKLYSLSNVLYSLFPPASSFNQTLRKLGYSDNFIYTTPTGNFLDDLIKQYLHHQADSVADFNFLHLLQESPLSILNYKDSATGYAYDTLIQRLAFKAGIEIYQKLLMATINIHDARLIDGNELKIDLVWYKDGDITNQKEDNRQELETATFTIRKVGWHTNIAETSLLIKRIDEEFLPADYPLSRSNFKPTAGAALMWSYHNSYRGWKDTRQSLQNHSFHTGSWTGNTLRWLEPSFGLNVTYLDFDNNQTFELGFGPMVGLWRNKMFVTAGYNLMVQGQSPYYVGIGFSFSKIAETIGKNVEQNPSRD